ncbi:MAG: triphosphoribosyl-dephospho-CoA synthase [Candidatus Methanogaster sp.]|nr:MAG: triphosphoribosyl-dephospho-CoA synthase [ANME-2 cluster archaeon]
MCICGSGVISPLFREFLGWCGMGDALRRAGFKDGHAKGEDDHLTETRDLTHGDDNRDMKRHERDMNDPSHLARCAQLAMVLEVAAHPKPGNVDRDHDFPDTTFEHFLASAVGTHPVLKEAARSRAGAGAMIRAAAEESLRWQRGGNTHFGAFVLLIPLLMAAGSKTQASKIVLDTTSKDAVEFYRAFSIAEVRIDSVPDFDLGESNSSDRIREDRVKLIDLMKLSADHDLETF